MARIRSKNTRPEIMVRSILHRLGYRFTLKRRDLPGRPDIVLPLRKTAIFVHGCFWHRHAGCRDATMPRSRVDFWEKKFRENVARDQKNKATLRRLGWRVLVIWECQIYKDPLKQARRLNKWLIGTGSSDAVFDIPGGSKLLQIAAAKADYRLMEKPPRQDKP